MIRGEIKYFYWRVVGDEHIAAEIVRRIFDGEKWIDYDSPEGTQLRNELYKLYADGRKR